VTLDHKHTSHLAPILERLLSARTVMGALPALAVLLGCLLPLFYVLELFASGGPVEWLGAWDLIQTDPFSRGMVWFTVWQAAASMALTLVIGLPVALIMGRYRLPMVGGLRALLTVPFIMPTMVAAMGFLALLGPGGWLERAGGPDLLGTAAAIILAHAWYNVAGVVRLVEPTLARLDPAGEEAARLLGADGWQRFKDVIWPALWPPLAAAAVLTFAFSFTSFAVVEVLGGNNYHTVEGGIYHYASKALIIPHGARVAATLTTIQLLVSLGVLWAYGALQAKGVRRVPLTRESRGRRVLPRKDRWAVYPLLSAVLIFELFPLAAVALASVGLPGEFNLEGWAQINEPKEVDGRFTSLVLEVSLGQAMVNSLAYALLTGLIALPLGLLAAKSLARARQAGKWWAAPADGLLMLPLAVSAVMVGFGYWTLYDGESPWPDLRLEWWLPAMAHVMVAYPFVLRAMLPALQGLDKAYGEGARMLGASPLRAWFQIELPLLRRPLLVGLVFAVAVSLGEFGASLLLTRPEWMTLPLLINARYNRPFAPVAHSTAFAIATLLMIMAGTLFALLERLRVPGQEGEF